MRIPSVMLMTVVAQELKALFGGAYEVSWVPYKAEFKVSFASHPVGCGMVTLPFETAID